MFSGQYSIIKISDSILDDVFEIMKLNKYFFSRTQLHDVTREECREDIYTLPPDTDMSQKFYLAFYKENECIAILDYIEGYPDSDVVYLGLLMINPGVQRAGVGRNMISTFVDCVKNNGFKAIKLGCYEDNEIGFSFWNRMGFNKEKVSIRDNDGKEYNLIHMQKVL